MMIRPVQPADAVVWQTRDVIFGRTNRRRTRSRSGSLSRELSMSLRQWWWCRKLPRSSLWLNFRFGLRPEAIRQNTQAGYPGVFFRIPASAYFNLRRRTKRGGLRLAGLAGRGDLEFSFRKSNWMRLWQKPLRERFRHSETAVGRMALLQTASYRAPT
jgi:hypothetical protein